MLSQIKRTLERINGALEGLSNHYTENDRTWGVWKK